MPAAGCKGHSRTESAFRPQRRDGLPSYQLACVLDDAALQVTDVVRGRDLLKSTARQILLQRALGLPEPLYFHTDLLRDDNGHRLAKCHHALSLKALRDAGLSALDLRSRLRLQPHHNGQETP